MSNIGRMLMHKLQNRTKSLQIKLIGHRIAI
jgi:hypothetical protein